MSATDLEKLLPKHKLVKVAEVKEAASQRQRKCDDMLISEEDFVGANFDPFAEENREFAREFYSSNHYRVKMPFMREATEGKEGAGAVNDGSANEHAADTKSESDTGAGAVVTDTPQSSEGLSDAVSASANTAKPHGQNPQDTFVSSDHPTTDDGYFVADEALATDNESALPPDEREWQGAGKWYTPEEKAQVQPERQLFTPVEADSGHSGAQQEAADMSAAPDIAPLASAPQNTEAAPVTTTSYFQDHAPWMQLSQQDKEDLLHERITMSLDGGVTEFSVEALASEFDLPQEFVAAMIKEYISPVDSSAAASTAGQAVPESSAYVQDSSAQAGSNAAAALHAAHNIADSTKAEAAAITSSESPASEERSSSCMTMEECIKELRAFAAELDQSDAAVTTKQQKAALPQHEARGDSIGNAYDFARTPEDDNEVALRKLSAMLYAAEEQRAHEQQSAVATAGAAANAVAMAIQQDGPVTTESSASAFSASANPDSVQTAQYDSTSVPSAAPNHASDTETGGAGISSEQQGSAEGPQPQTAMSHEDSDLAALKQFMQDVAVAKAAAQAAVAQRKAISAYDTDTAGNVAPAPSSAVSALPELLPPLPQAQPTEPRMSWQERDQLIKYNDQGEVLDMSLDAIMAAVEDYQERHPEDDSLISTTGIEILPEDALAAKQRQRLAQQRAAAIEQAYDEAALKKSRWAKRQQKEQVADFDSAADIDAIPWESEATAATQFVNGAFVPSVPLAALGDSASFAENKAGAEEDGLRIAADVQDALAVVAETKQPATVGKDAGASIAEEEVSAAVLATAADTDAAQEANAPETTAAAAATATAATSSAHDSSAQDKPKSGRTVLSLRKTKGASKSTTKTTSKNSGQKSRDDSASVTAVHATAQIKAEDSVSTNDIGGAPWAAIATTTTVEAATASLQAALESGAGDSEALAALHQSTVSVAATAPATKQRQATPRPAKSSTTAKARSSNSKSRGKAKATTSKGKKGSAAKAPSKRSRSQGKAKD